MIYEAPDLDPLTQDERLERFDMQEALAELKGKIPRAKLEKYSGPESNLADLAEYRQLVRHLDVQTDEDFVALFNRLAFDALYG